MVFKTSNWIFLNSFLNHFFVRTLILSCTNTHICIHCKYISCPVAAQTNVHTGPLPPGHTQMYILFMPSCQHTHTLIFVLSLTKRHMSIYWSCPPTTVTPIYICPVPQQQSHPYTFILSLSRYTGPIPQQQSHKYICPVPINIYIGPVTQQQTHIYICPVPINIYWSCPSTTVTHIHLSCPYDHTLVLSLTSLALSHVCRLVAILILLHLSIQVSSHYMYLWSLKSGKQIFHKKIHVASFVWQEKGHLYSDLDSL